MAIKQNRKQKKKAQHKEGKTGGTAVQTQKRKAIDQHKHRETTRIKNYEGVKGQQKSRWGRTGPFNSQKDQQPVQSPRPSKWKRQENS